jgi:hypothetical protein
MNPLVMAQRAIATNGATCTWIKSNAMPTDAETNANQPWKRTEAISGRALVSPAQFVCKILLKRNTGLAMQLFALQKGTEVPMGAEMGIMAGGLPFRPEITDTVIKPDGSAMSISSIGALEPAGVPLLWYVAFDI